MNIENWNLYYKIHETELRPTTTQMCYEPRVNPEGTVFCMNFCFPSSYQSKQPRISYTQGLVEFAFQRELKYLDAFKNYPWAPEILDITDSCIFIRWYKQTCNELIYKDKNLNSFWLTDLKQIITDQVNAGYLKCTVYPHSHYYDNNGQMRTIDFYATIEKENPYLKYDQIIGLIGTDTNRFEESRENQFINIETLFRSGLLQYSKWPTDLIEIYNEIYHYE